MKERNQREPRSEGQINSKHLKAAAGPDPVCGTDKHVYHVVIGPIVADIRVRQER